VTRKTLQIEQPAREVERHIDRANGAPAVEAAMCSNNGTQEIGIAATLSGSSRCAGRATVTALA
jgi:hypothetical protein